jgi:hypothetical protein
MAVCKTFTVNQLVFASEKFSRGLREPYLREYFLPRTRCFMQFCMNEEGSMANITRR